MISDEELKEVAEYIIIDHAIDIEYLSVVEMSSNRLEMDNLTEAEREIIWGKLSTLIDSAKVSVEFS